MDKQTTDLSGITDILELIKTRRTIHKYMPNKFVDWEHVSRILDAGRHAPSCGNLQNWKFIIINDPGLRKAIAQAALGQYWMVDAPVHIVICMEPHKAERYYGVRGERLYTVQNGAAAAMSMMLEAHSLGLGTAWVGAFDEQKVLDIISGEPHLRPQIILTIGWPAEIPPKPPKWAMESQAYFNAWRNRLTDPARYMRQYSAIWAQAIKDAKNSLKKAGKKLAENIKEKVKKEERVY